MVVDVPTKDGTADSYLVVPEGGPHPGVLLFEDAFGLRPRLFEMAGRIAERGYAVLAPNILYRGGRCPQFDMADMADPEKRSALFGRIMPNIQQLTAERIAADTESYLDFFAAQPGVSAEQVVVVGYCMGGTNALRAIEAHPSRIKAVATFHAGSLATDEPDSPHLSVGNITGEAYFAHADQDHAMSAEQIEVLEAALDAAGVTYRSELYEGAPHGFTMSDTAMHHEEGEKRHWENLFALLERTR
ncbi:dienelactone hydrolase family protein [Kibdelosporangium phytohabitans]|nr:dienelactone hydrolase family protein [Kibdelosporangium phytohabitans]MBE1464595.1 carboxymethylenebutenolidase [Kibdelosporangium phytohabitans]